MRGTCETCKHYAALNGNCRAHAPVAILLGLDQQGKAVFAGTWPPTKPENWCAEHQPEVNNG